MFEILGPSFTSPNSISLLHLWKTMLQTLGTLSTLLIPETCFHLHLHVYTTQSIVGKWFCISKSSAFRLRSCEMFIAFWRFLGEKTSIPTRCWNALLAQPRTGVALVDAGFSLAADRADRLTSTETGLHTWLVLWDGLRMLWPVSAEEGALQTLDLRPGKRKSDQHVDLQDESVCKMHWSDRSPCMFLFYFLVRAVVYFDFFWFVLPELVSQNFSSKRLIDETFSFL